MKKFLIGFSLISAVAATPALAAEGQAYLAADVGQSTYGGDANTLCNAVAGVAGVSCSKTDTAFRIGGGYAFTQNFGVEASYTDYGKASLTAAAAAPGIAANASASVKATALQIVGTGTLPLSDSFSLTAKAGLAAVTVDANANAALAIAGVGAFAVASAASASNNNLVWGIGAQFDVTPSIGIRVNYEDLGNVGDSATVGKYKLSAISAGVVFKF